MVAVARWAGVALCAMVAMAPAMGETLSGPIRAQVLSVVDGDTIVARARIWLGQEVETRVRLTGIDAPELRGRCAAERRAAERARALLVAAIGGGPVDLLDVGYDKYGGRVVARVRTADGRDLAETLQAAGLARRYDGGARRPWCS